MVASLLAVSVVAWQHLLHATSIVRSDVAVASHLPHLGRDVLLGLPVAWFAVGQGRRLARMIGFGRASVSLQAAITSLVFFVAMIAAVPVHALIDQALDPAVHNEGGFWLTHALRDSMVGQLIALPILFLAVAAARRPQVVLSTRNLTRALIVVAAVAMLAATTLSGPAVVLGASIVALLAWSDSRRLGRAALAVTLVTPIVAFPDVIAPDSAGAIVDANGCEVGAPVRTYDVAAINVEITLNAYGDHDPNAFMYVLEDRIADVRAQEALGTVTPGLRDDAIQPLAIRANVGECLVINFTNRLAARDASFHVYGLPYTAANAGGRVGTNPNGLAAPNQSITYTFPVPADPAVEGAYNFHSQSDSRQTMAHGLFGTLIIEPAGSVYLDPVDGVTPVESGWEAIIVDPNGVDFREFVIMMHEIGDEDFDVPDANGDPNPQIDDVSGSYRPASRGLNYRSESFRNRLLLGADKSLAYSSYAFGEPATPMPRSYLGEPTKTRISHPGSELFHVYHLHGGGTRWARDDQATDDYYGGLDKNPQPDAQTTRIDSQAAGPLESFTLEHECGAGGCQQAAGDFLFHCHIGSHYVSGMWSFWRVYDTEQSDLARMPADPGYVAPGVAQGGTSLDLIGSTVDGQTLVAAVDADQPNELAVEDYVASLLPPQGQRLDDQDATVWDWDIVYENGDLSRPLVLGEPEDDTVWPAYAAANPNQRPPVRFNLDNGRLAWPMFTPQLAQRPPFSPNGHGGAPWLGEDESASNPGAVCPSDVTNPGRRVLDYPITAIDIELPITETFSDPNGMIYALSEDVDDIRSGAQTAEPLTIRSNVGDCISVLLTSEQEDANHGGFAKVNMHTHFVQFDPQASDGVITGLSYEQSVRPYATENRTLDVAAEPGDTVIEVTNTSRLRVGISIGVGLGEGMCDPITGLPVADPTNADRRCAEVRTIVDIGPSNTITLDAPLENHHAVGEAVGVEFVQYLWYTDVDTGTVFFHDHVSFTNWDHGLFAAHIVEPVGATYHDPVTGDEIRTGTVADIRVPAGTPIGGGRTGSFRELMVFLNSMVTATDGAAGGGDFATLNMRSAPLNDRDGEFPFSSVVNGDPVTPMLRAYVGDNVIFRNLSVVERMGALRITGHQFTEDRFAADAPILDTSSVGASEREDLVLLDGAGGSGGFAGDYLFHNTFEQDLERGAWGIMRVHDTDQADLQTLPDGPAPAAGAGFPQLTETGLPPLPAIGAGVPCPQFAPVRSYSVSIFDSPVGATFGGTMFALSADQADITAGLIDPEPLVLRVNQGECLEITLNNNSGQRAGLDLSRLVQDPQGSAGTAVGFNPDSTLDKDTSRLYRYYANGELGTAMFFNSADPRSRAEGAYGAVVVEPAGSSYLDPETGLPAT